MRGAHYGKPFPAVCAPRPRWYRVPMQTTNRLARSLRAASAVALVTTVALWAGTGAHRGWTQTSKVVVQRDEITGIDFPVREKTFVVGLELLGAGAGFAALLAAASVAAGRRRSAAPARA